MSPRTLQRYLHMNGTSYSRLLAETLREQAQRALEDSRVEIAELATRLGFSDPGNFSRAFRRWTGKSPAAFRRARKRHRT